MTLFFEDWPRELFSKLPFELWLAIKKMFIKSYLLAHLQYPVVVCKRFDDPIFSDYWTACSGFHKWTIERSGPFGSSLVSHYYKGKRDHFEWTGISSMILQRVFGVGVHLDENFLHSIFMENDFWNFEYIIPEGSEADSDEFLLGVDV